MLGVERTVSLSLTPPSGTATPAGTATAPPRRAAGGALGADRRPGGRSRREQVVRAGECQCCGLLVPAAHRLTKCPLCGSPVVHRLNENGRDGCTRRGQNTGGVAPVPQPQYTLAQDALDRAFLGSGVQRVEAACGGCGDDLRGCLLLIREVIDGEIYDTLVEDEYGVGDGPTVMGACWHCDTELLPDTVILRDRKRRSEREIRELAQVA